MRSFAISEGQKVTNKDFNSEASSPEDRLVKIVNLFVLKQDWCSLATV